MRILIVLLFICGGSLQLAAQDLYFTFVDREKLSVSQSELQAAVNIADIHELYPEDWVSDFLQTTISIIGPDGLSEVSGSGPSLSKAQKSLLQSAKVGSSVKVSTKYIPNNTLKEKMVRQMDYTYDVVPFSSAYFKGGEEERTGYFNKAFKSALTQEEVNILDLSLIHI